MPDLLCSSGQKTTPLSDSRKTNRGQNHSLLVVNAMLNSPRATLPAFVLTYLCCAVAAIAAGEAINPDHVTLQTILSRVHEHAGTKEWRSTAGWKDEQLESWLEKLTGKIAAATNF